MYAQRKQWMISEAIQGIQIGITAIAASGYDLKLQHSTSMGRKLGLRDIELGGAFSLLDGNFCTSREPVAEHF